MKLFEDFRTTLENYSRQFWIVVFGVFLGTFGFNLIWAYFLIIISEQLNIGLTPAGSLMTIFSASMVVSYIFLSPFVDRVGRKPFMVVGLLGSGMSFVVFSLIHSYWGMAAVMIVTGLASPFYQLGSDSMVADLVPEKELESAYAYTRVAMNVGFAVGPFAGGFLVSFSHQLALQVAGLFTILASVAIFLMVKETLPETFKPGVEAIEDGGGAKVKSGYASVFRNKSFLVFSVAILLTQFGYLPALSLGSLFAKSTLGIPESVYGIVPAINGVMNILFLVAVAGWAKGRNSLLVLGLGSLLYSLGTGSFYLNQGIGWMIASMIVITIGELMVVPTAITFVSKSAPSDSRGTYLGVFNLMTMLVMGLAPVIFGLITDASNMRNAWLIMSALSLIGCVIFFLAGRIQQQAPAAEAA